MASLATDITDYLEWMAVHNYARTTITSRRYYLGYFLEFMGRLELTDTQHVVKEHISAYQDHLYQLRQTDGHPLEVATQIQRLIPITQIFAWLRRQGRITVDPAIDLLMPRAERALPEATLSASEIATILAVPDITRPLGLRDRAILEVFYSTAIRRAELIALTPRDVDYARGTLFIRSGKGAKDRYVPIGERALFWTRLYADLSRPRLAGDTNPEQLFISSVGTAICKDWLSRRVHRYIQQAGIDKHGSCHLIRHSVATLMLEGGADIRYVAEMLGHARLETTQRYTRVSIDRLKAVHAATHPAASLNIAMANEICTLYPTLQHTT